MKYDEFEQKLLELAVRTTDPLTSQFVGYKLRIRISEAEELLDQMATAGHLSLQSDEDGNLFYEAVGIRRGSESHLPPPLPAPTPAVSAMVVNPTEGTFVVPASPPQDTTNDIVAGLLAFLIPGAGQLYRGQVARAVFYFILIPFGYLALFIPGLILHIKSIMEAVRPPQPTVTYIPIAQSGPPQVNVKIHIEKDEESEHEGVPRGPALRF